MKIEILERLKNQLLAQYVPVEEVEDKAINLLRKSGILHKDKLELTEYGTTRNNMSPSERAIDREVKKSGRQPYEYYYDPITNRAKLLKNKF